MCYSSTVFAQHTFGWTLVFTSSPDLMYGDIAVLAKIAY